MVKIRPFAGYRYNKDKVDVGKAIFPPYEIRRTDYKRILGYKCNVLKLILGDIGSDRKNGDRYEHSAKLLREWIEKGYLRKEGEPVIYVYSQEFEIDGKRIERTGFISLVEIEDLKKKIRAHEMTLHDTMINRKILIEKTRSNVGLIFSLYHDDEKTIDSILENSKKTRPEIDVSTENKYENMRHRLWIIRNRDEIKKLTEEMEDKTLLIADGHHRYMTSLKYMKENPEDEKGKYVSMMMVNMKDRGVVILPTHRLIGGLKEFKREKFMERLEQNFHAESLKFNRSNEKEKMKELKEKMKREGKHTFGMYAGGDRFYTIKLKENEKLFRKFDSRSKVWIEFDMDILCSLVFKEMLGVDISNSCMHGKIDYVKDIKERVHECVNKVREGEFQVAFFLNPTDIETVRKISERGDTLPPKTTCFYPKVYSGVVIYKFDNDSRNF